VASTARSFDITTPWIRGPQGISSKARFARNRAGLARVVLVRVHRDRELTADRAAREVAQDPKIVSMVIKMTALHAQWDWFRRDLAELMNRGVGRRNSAQDYLLRTRQFPGTADQKKLQANLAAMSTPHPLDVHPPLADRAYALDVDPAALIPAGVQALRADPPVEPAVRAFEERITADDLDYTRVPGHPIRMLEDPALPEGLAFEPAT
jgi:hypothetical protein